MVMICVSWQSENLNWTYIAKMIRNGVLHPKKFLEKMLGV